MVFVRCNIIFWCFVLTRISTTNCVKFGKTPSVRTYSAVASLREIPDSSVTSQARSNEATSSKLKANGFENSESSLSSYLAWQIECYTLRKMWWSIMLLTLNHDILSSKLPGLLKNPPSRRFLNHQERIDFFLFHGRNIRKLDNEWETFWWRKYNYDCFTMVQYSIW